MKATDMFKHSQYQRYLKQLLSDLKKLQKLKQQVGKRVKQYYILSRGSPKTA